MERDFTSDNAVDFIKESDGWKIWHYRDSADLGFPVDGSLLSLRLDQVMKGRTVGGTFPEPNRVILPLAEEGMFNPKKSAKFSPELPQPFDTWSEDISYSKSME